MPVKFKGISEYSSTYQWSPSYRSARFHPTFQQSMPEAGLRSDEMSLLIEPGFTKKRKVPHRKPETNQCLMWWQNDAFSDYSESISDVVENSPKSDPVNLKTFTVKPKKSPKKNSGKLEKNPKKIGKPTQARTSKPGRDDERKENATMACYKENKQAKLVDKNLSTWERDNIHVLSQQPERKRKQSPEKQLVVVKERQGNQNKPTKERESKSAKSSPVKEKKMSPKKETKPKNIPMRYRPLHQRMLSAHQTEYQYMFRKPTKFVPSSPLISALDVIHASSPAIPPHKSPKMFSKSEYAMKFQNQSPLSKSVPAFSSPASPSLKLKVKNLPTSPLHLHRSPRRVASEYAVQFPERDFPAKKHDKVLDEAHHNKLNRDGTLFDKDHVNQLCSPKNKYWDMSSVSSDNTIAQGSKSSRVLDKKSKAPTEKPHSDENDAELKEWDNGNDDDDMVESIIAIEKDSLGAPSTVSSEGTLVGTKPVARKLAWDENSTNEDENDEYDDRSTTVALSEGESTSSDGYGGRLPTPQLQQIGGGLRSHHDLTTPSVGGALLTSPTNSMKKKRMPSPVQNSVTVTPVQIAKVEKKEVKAVQEETPRAATQKAKVGTPKAVNKTTPLLSKSMNLPRRMHHTVRAPIQGSLRGQEFQHCGRNSRPVSSFDHLSLVSNRSAASAENLLQKSLQRRDFWDNK